jgi:hypothetical protein
MHEHTTNPFPHQQLLTEDPFTEVVRQRAQRLLAEAIEAEVAMFLARYADRRDAQGRCAVSSSVCASSHRVSGSAMPLDRRPSSRYCQRSGRSLPEAHDRPAVGSPPWRFVATASYDPGREASSPSGSRRHGGGPPFDVTAGERAAEACVPSRSRRRNKSPGRHAFPSLAASWRQ